MGRKKPNHYGTQEIIKAVVPTSSPMAPASQRGPARWSVPRLIDAMLRDGMESVLPRARQADVTQTRLLQRYQGTLNATETF